jgi:hypothetical protein
METSINTHAYILGTKIFEQQRVLRAESLKHRLSMLQKIGEGARAKVYL